MTKPKPLSKRNRARFQRAASLLRAVCDDGGYQVYVSGSGTMNLMSGDSHDRDGSPRKDRVLEFESVPWMSGGDW